MPKSIEDELRRLKERVKLLEGIVLRGEPVPRPELDRAVEAFIAGDPKPFDEYLKKGGKLPRVERTAKRKGTGNHK